MYILFSFLGGALLPSGYLFPSLFSTLRFSYPWWLACNLALSASGWMTYHAGLIEQATFIIALLLTRLVTPNVSLYS
jgi:hypothetical protein